MFKHTAWPTVRWGRNRDGCAANDAKELLITSRRPAMRAGLYPMVLCGVPG
jgi:hypothetical protein